jgi:hypothetical protein
MFIKTITLIKNKIKSKIHWIEKFILISIIVSFLFFSLRIYQLNLYTKVNSKFNVYYNVGSVLIQDWNTINQYRTKSGQFTTNYFTSLYEPQVKINNKISTIYRPKPQEIKYKNENWYLYIAEMRGYLTKNPDLIPNYWNNLITGPSLNLYGQNPTIYNYDWSELFESYINNKVNVDVNCSKFQLAKCPSIIDKLNIQIFPDPEPNAFRMKYNYIFDQKLLNEQKQTINAFIVPEDFLICPSTNYDKNSCIEAQDKNWTKRDNFPIWILEDQKDTKKITIKDLNFSDFYITNLKIADFYNINYFEDELLNKSKEYYFVHPSGVWLKVIPDDSNANVFLQRQFGSIKIENNTCLETYCQSGFKVTLDTKK